MKKFWHIPVFILMLLFLVFWALPIALAEDAKPESAAEIRLSENSSLKIMAVSSEADKLNAQIQVLTLQLEKLNTQTIPALVDAIYVENKVSKDDYKLDLSHKCGDTPCMALVRNKTPDKPIAP